MVTHTHKHYTEKLTERFVVHREGTHTVTTKQILEVLEVAKILFSDDQSQYTAKARGIYFAISRLFPEVYGKFIRETVQGLSEETKE